MRKIKSGLGLAAAGLLLAASGGTAFADERGLLTPYGLGVSVGLGVEDFTGETMRDTTSTCGTWDVRAIVGTREYLGFEAGYFGSARGIEAPIGGEDAVLVGTTVEVLARANLRPHAAWLPYGFVGGAWRRYDVAQAEFTTSDSGMNDTDDELAIPMGAGLSYRYRGVMADARFTFRLASKEDLVLRESTAFAEEYAAMHTWGVTTNIGYEF